MAILNAENCDVYQYVINDTPSHPTRDVTVVRYIYYLQKKNYFYLNVQF